MTQRHDQRRGSAGRAVGAMTVVIGLGAVLQAPVGRAAASVVRYVAPGGQGSACTKASPCQIETGLTTAPSGATLIVEPGRYGSANAPLTDTLEDATDLTIVGGGAAHPSVIFDNHPSWGVEINAGSELSGVKIVYSGTGIGLETGFGGADHDTIVATAPNSSACFVERTLVDSVCEAKGSSSVGLNLDIATASTSPFEPQIVGDDLIALGPGGEGIEEVARQQANLTMTVVDSIVDGLATGVDAQSPDTGTAVVNLVHSIYNAQTSGTNGEGIAAVHTSAEDIEGSPTFVNATHDNFKERPNSLTINRGAPDSRLGSTDLAGKPRIVGPAPDMGAYEISLSPSVRGLKVTKREKHAVRVRATVDPEELRTVMTVIARAHGKDVTAKKAVTGNLDREVSITIHGLRHRAVYRVHAVVKSSAGHDTSPSIKVRTR